MSPVLFHLYQLTAEASSAPVPAPYTHKSQYNGMRDGNSETRNPIVIYCALKLLALQ